MGDDSASTVDIVLIGGGIMSATMATMIQLMRPDWSIAMFERAESVATESSNAWNNAGTGHAGLCELNYTPLQKNGSVSTAKALTVNTQFQESLRYWAELVQRGSLVQPDRFIRSIPHVSYVSGETDVAFLRKRYDALAHKAPFRTMVFSDDSDQLVQWAPLMFEGRGGSTPIAMTRSVAGTDVNFGELTAQLVQSAMNGGMHLFTRHQVTGLSRRGDDWRVKVVNRDGGGKKFFDARFVFVGAGGTALHLLQASGIDEAKGYGGFPVSGQFLHCTDPELIARHAAKVYGQPQLNAPPMSMPHLDSRVIDGQRVLLFGPFAGVEPRFLKAGSWTDLFRSIKPNNLRTYLDVAHDEFGLTKYLIGQVLLKQGAKMDVLRDFIPSAQDSEWVLHNAGMRVQTLKPGANRHGKLEFGTEIVSSADGTIAGLLGASPGASTAVSIVAHILERSFPAEMARGVFDDIFPLRTAAATDYERTLLAGEDIIRDVLGLEGYGSNI
ncbi:MAG: malate dehydrogenase (quinone) [Thermomicrobiales bacterium]|nr:malate dehydrogenase (quinone) [Thermomicrobiales bacterium]